MYKFSDSDIIETNKLPGAINFSVKADVLIDKRDDEQMTIIWLNASDLGQLLMDMDNAETVESSDVYEGFVLTNTDKQIMVLLDAEKLSDYVRENRVDFAISNQVLQKMMQSIEDEIERCKKNNEYAERLTAYCKSMRLSPQ